MTPIEEAKSLSPGVDAYAVKHLGAPAGWRCFRLDCGKTPEGFFKACGNIPTGVSTKGEMAGWVSFVGRDKKTDMEFLVSKAKLKESGFIL